MSKTFDDLLKKLSACPTKKVSVAAAQDQPILEAVAIAKKQGIADAILVGDEAKIREIASGINMDLSGYEIINEPDLEQAALKAVS
ncbi:MAG: phosphate butyryltransferase, partial [Lachnospiraceae bacterium]|nr:phosphate butyryltransferase [Lachnospiraceae bacterium]